MKGRLQNSTKGLGHENVNGLSLVPKPPTKINAFIKKLKIFFYIIETFCSFILNIS